MNKIKIQGTKNRKGYTLVELIVVLVILAIVGTLSVLGYSAYQRYTGFKKNNEYAQTLFSAAQLALTEAKETGQLEEMEDMLEEFADSDPNVRKLTGGMIKDGYEAELAQDKGRDYEGLYSIVFEKSEKPEDYTGVKEQIYQMVYQYVYDAEVLNATFSVEFDPVDAVVWGVCYNDRAEQFFYGGGGASTEEKNDISGRSSEVRGEILLGYYGAEMLSKRAPTKAKKASIKNITLVNGDRLYLSVESEALVSEPMKFEVYYEGEVKPAASFTINGIPNGKDNMIKADVRTYVSATDTYKELKDVPFLVSVVQTPGKDVEMQIVLDAVDLSAAQQLETNTKDYSKTYSIMRLGFKWLHDFPFQASMYAKVTDQSGKSLNSNIEDCLYADSKWDEDSKEMHIEVANARHLFNARFLEKAERDDYKVYYKQIQNKDQPEGDIVWDGEEGFVAKGNVFSALAKVAADGSAAARAFPAIPLLNEDSTFTSDSNSAGKPYAIKGLVLNETKENTPLGLFGKNDGIIHNVRLTNAKVTGVDYTGTLCGLNNGLLSDIEVERTRDNKTDITFDVTGRKYVGGIVGSDISGQKSPEGNLLIDAPRQYKNLTNSANVEGAGYVGGVVGYNMGKYRLTDPAVFNIENCHNTGYIEGATTEGIAIGGIVGYNELSEITQCTSNPEVTLEAVNKRHKRDGVLVFYGNFVGGIVGLNKEAVISKCTAGNPNNDVWSGFVPGKTYVGGIVGLHIKAGTSELPLLQNELPVNGNKSFLNVIGESYVGGITSINNNPGTKIRDAIQAGSCGNLIEQEIIPNYMSPTNPVGVTLNEWVFGGTVYISNKNGGGIVGYNGGIINGCYIEVNNNSKTIYTKLIDDIEENLGTNLGGIAGHNAGDGAYARGVIKAYNIGLEAGQKITLQLVGNRNVGGVSGYNDGIITDTVQNEARSFSVNVSGMANIGGIVGFNGEKGLVEQQEVHNTVLSRIEPLDVTQYDIGAIVGYNQGTVNSCKSHYVTIESEDPVAGVAGVNTSSGRIIAATSINVYGKNYTAGVVSLNQAGGFISGGASHYVEGNDYVAGIVTINEGEVQASRATDYELQSSYITKRLIKGNDYVGGIASVNRGKIATSTVYTVEGNDYVGGFAAINEGDLININNNYSNVAVSGLNVTAAGNYVGGIAGTNGAGGVIDGSRVYDITVTGQDNIGGIAGENLSGGKVQNCAMLSKDIMGNIESRITGRDNVGGVIGRNVGEFKHTRDNSAFIKIVGTGTNTGGFIGYNENINAPITDLENWAEVTGKDSVGGVVGNTRSDVLRCMNLTAVKGERNVGGVIGTQSGSANIINCSNASAARITATGDNAGGIIGQVDIAESNDGKSTSMNVNQRVVDGAGNGVGGMIGYISPTTKGYMVTDCSNTGVIIANNDTSGGIIGLNEGIDLNIDGCRNYGMPLFNDKALAGILGKSTNPSVVIQHCFGASNPGIPITNKSNTSHDKDNFYFVADIRATSVYKSALQKIQLLGNPVAPTNRAPDTEQIGTALKVVQLGANNYKAVNADGTKEITGLPNNPLIINDAYGELSKMETAHGIYLAITNALQEDIDSMRRGVLDAGTLSIPEPDVSPEESNSGGTEQSEDIGSVTEEPIAEETVTPVPMATIDVAEGTVEVESVIKVTNKADSNVTEQSVWLTQDSLTWQNDEKISRYQVYITPSDSNPETGTWDTYPLRITKNNDSQIPIGVELETDEKDKTGAKIWEALEFTQYDTQDEQGNLTRIFNYDIGYHRTVESDTEEVNYKSLLKASVQCIQYWPVDEDSKTGLAEEPVTSYRLVLPDITSNNGIAQIRQGEGVPFVHTKSAIFVQHPVDEQTFLKSKELMWYRTQELDSDNIEHWSTKWEEQQ